MATLREKLDAAIQQQQGEVDRLSNVAKADLPAARAVLKQLAAVRDQVDKTPDLEASFTTLKALGVKLDTE